MKIKRKKADVVFSELVRNRANWVCESCGKDKSHDKQYFDCAHIMGRRSVGLRWHPCNALGLCRSCHIFYTGHPFDWADFCRERYGDDRVSELRLISTRPVHWSKKVREEIYKFMKEQLKSGTFEQHPLMHKFGK